MKFSIASRKALMSRALAQHIAQKFRTALERFADRVRDIRIRIDDLNGSRGGADKRCRAVISLRSSGTLLVEAVSADAYAASAWTAEKCKFALARRVDAQRTRMQRRLLEY